MGFLSDLTAEIRADLAARPPDAPALAKAAAAAPRARDLAATVRGCADEDGVGIIAELKRASPSAGPIAPDADAVVRATAFDGADVAAISVLTEPRYFGGSIDDLRAVRAVVLHPVLRKDFLLHPDQVLEARAAGADSVLLITASLGDDELIAMMGTARGLGMEPLVETHSDDDLERALATDAAVVGVNARDLESLEVDVPAALERLRRIPAGRVGVLESGVASRTDVLAAVEAGASGVLVGEALMRAPDPRSKVSELLGKERPG